MRFRAKVDWWIAISIIAGITMPAIIAIVAGKYWMFLVSAAAVAMVFSVGFPQWYETKEHSLIIRSGLVTRSIPYSHIIAVRPSSDWGSALALSLDRIQVEYDSCAILIAPDRKDLFISEIGRHAPQLSKYGQNLVSGVT
jgi:PH (Pleckstrin Homology) domain-containing protein